MLRWLQKYPHFLEKTYQVTHRLVKKLSPLFARLGYERANRWLAKPEEWAKTAVFDCRMCGQCILHSTGMTCPMTCPKNLRNGPCGGVRPNGHCEVIPDMRCVWVEAFERSQHMPIYGNELHHIQPPVNRRLEASSAWVTMLTGEDKDVPPGWVAVAGIIDISQPET